MGGRLWKPTNTTCLYPQLTPWIMCNFLLTYRVGQLLSVKVVHRSVRRQGCLVQRHGGHNVSDVTSVWRRSQSQGKWKWLDIFMVRGAANDAAEAAVVDRLPDGSVFPPAHASTVWRSQKDKSPTKFAQCRLYIYTKRKAYLEVNQHIGSSWVSMKSSETSLRSISQLEGPENAGN